MKRKKELNRGAEHNRDFFPADKKMLPAIKLEIATASAKNALEFTDILFNGD
jgi:hypothetical protein